MRSINEISQAQEDIYSIKQLWSSWENPMEQIQVTIEKPLGNSGHFSSRKFGLGSQRKESWKTREKMGRSVLSLEKGPYTRKPEEENEDHFIRRDRFLLTRKCVRLSVL